MRDREGGREGERQRGWYLIEPREMRGRVIEGEIQRGWARMGERVIEGE